MYKQCIEVLISQANFKFIKAAYGRKLMERFHKFLRAYGI